MSLKKLMFNKELVGTLETGRSYSNSIDKILEPYEKNSNIKRSTNNIESSIQKLLSGRIDYFLEYPKAAAYTREKFSQVPFLP